MARMRSTRRFDLQGARESIPTRQQPTLADVEVKTYWQLAEHAGYARPDAMQRLLTVAASSPGASLRASSGAVHELRPVSNAVTSEYGQPGIMMWVSLPRP